MCKKGIEPVDVVAFLEELRFNLADHEAEAARTPEEVSQELRAMGVEPPKLPDVIRRQLNTQSS
jgi:hypothetical protein